MQSTADIVAIKQLVARYCDALDRGDGEAWAATFVDDGRFETVGRTPVVGRSAIAALIAGRAPYRSRHFPTNLLIDVDGDSARMRAYLKVVSEGRITVTGEYADVLRRDGGQWRFVERVFAPDADAQG